MRNSRPPSHRIFAWMVALVTMIAVVTVPAPATAQSSGSARSLSSSFPGSSGGDSQPAEPPAQVRDTSLDDLPLGETVVPKADTFIAPDDSVVSMVDTLTDNGRVTLHLPSGEIPKVGSGFVVNVVPEEHDGVIATVTDVTPLGEGLYQITTKTAQLTDVYEQFIVRKNVDLSDSFVVVNGDLLIRDGRRSKSGSRGSQKMALPGGKVCKRKSGGKGKFELSELLSDSTVSISLNADVAIKAYHDEKGKPKDSRNVTFVLDISYDWEFSRSEGFICEISPEKTVQFSIPVAGPLALTINPYARLSGEIGGGVSFSASLKAGIEAQLRDKIDVSSPDIDSDAKFGDKDILADVDSGAKAEAKAELSIELGIRAEIGPNVRLASAGGFVEFGGALNASHTWTPLEIENREVTKFFKECSLIKAELVVRVGLEVSAVYLINWETKTGAGVVLSREILNTCLKEEKEKENPYKQPERPSYEDLGPVAVDSSPAPKDSVGGYLDSKDLLGRARDFVFIIDTTASMDNDIFSVKENLRRTLDQLHSSAPKSRISLIEYRDWSIPFEEPDGIYPARTVIDLTPVDEYETILDAINGLTTEGNVDVPEDMIAGIWLAMQQDFSLDSQPNLFVIGDAPGHDPDCKLGLSFADIRSFLTDGVALNIENLDGTGESSPSYCQELSDDVRNSPLPAWAKDGDPFAAEVVNPGARAFQPEEAKVQTRPRPIVVPMLRDEGATATNGEYRKEISAMTALAEATGGRFIRYDGYYSTISDVIADNLDLSVKKPELVFSIPSVVEKNKPFEMSIKNTRIFTQNATAEVDLDDGAGWVALDPAHTWKVTIPETGVRNVTIRVTDDDGRSTEETRRIIVRSSGTLIKFGGPGKEPHQVEEAEKSGDSTLLIVAGVIGLIAVIAGGLNAAAVNGMLPQLPMPAPVQI